MIFPTILGAGILVFFLMRVIPGDICLVRWVDYNHDLRPELDDILTGLELCRHNLGLNDPLYVQLFYFIKGLLSLDLGVSMWTERPISEEIELRFALSLQLATMATAVSVFIAIPLGIISAAKQNTWIDYVIRMFAIAGVALPSFWLGILLILGILIGSQAWFGDPWMPPIEYVSLFEDPAANLSHLVLPAIATGYRYSAVVTRMTRSTFLEVLREDYIRTATAKGLARQIIIKRHALRNACLPVITIIGMEMAFFMGGLVVTEQVFNLNGLGRLMLDSVLYADFNMVQSLVMLFVTLFVFINFVIDIIYGWLDPRIRYS